MSKPEEEKIQIDNPHVIETIQEVSEEDEPLEKVKEKPPPGINASLVMLYALFLFMFVIGWINLNSCPLNIFIPVYLIVAGFVGALAKFLSKCDNKHLFNFCVVLVVFNVIWHGLGSYWVYKEYQPEYDSTKGAYCNRTTYLLAFWVLTFQYTMFIFFIMLSACYMLMRALIETAADLMRLIAKRDKEIL